MEDTSENVDDKDDDELRSDKRDLVDESDGGGDDAASIWAVTAKEKKGRPQPGILRWSQCDRYYTRDPDMNGKSSRQISNKFLPCSPHTCLPWGSRWHSTVLTDMINRHNDKIVSRNVVIMGFVLEFLMSHNRRNPGSGLVKS